MMTPVVQVVFAFFAGVALVILMISWMVAVCEIDLVELIRALRGK